MPNILCIWDAKLANNTNVRRKSNAFQRHIVKIMSERENSIESHIPKLPCEMLKSRLYFTTRVELNIYDKMTAVQHRETISAPWNNCILNNGSLSLSICFPDFATVSMSPPGLLRSKYIRAIQLNLFLEDAVCPPFRLHWL